MIALILAERGLSCGQWSQVDQKTILTALGQAPFSYPLSLIQHAEGDLTATVDAALRQITETLPIDGNTVMVTLPDNLALATTLILDRDLTPADGIDLVGWRLEQRWGRRSRDFTTFGHLPDPQGSRIQALSVSTFLIQVLKLSLIERGADPLWMGTEALALASRWPGQSSVFIGVDGPHFQLTVCDPRGISRARVKYSRGELKIQSTAGNRDQVEAALQPTPSEGSPAYNYYLVDDLSPARRKHWDAYPLEDMRPFEDVVVEGVPVLENLPLRIRNVLTALINGQAVEVALNLFESPGLQDKPIRRPVPADAAREGAEAVVKPPGRIPRKPAAAAKPLVRTSRRFDLQRVLYPLIILLILAILVVPRYLEKPTLIRTPEKVRSDREETLIPAGGEELGPHTSPLRDYLRRSQTLLHTLNTVLAEFQPDSLIMLTMSRNRLQLEIAGGEAFTWDHSRVGLLVQHTQEPYPCCGGYRYVYELKIPDYSQPLVNQWLETGQVAPALKRGEAEIGLRHLAPREEGSYVQHPLIMTLRSAPRIMSLLARFPTLADNLFLEKIVIRSDPENPDPQATLFISHFQEAFPAD